MPTLLYDQTNITADMVALNNENPNSGSVTGAYGLNGISAGALMTANVIPRTAGVTGFTIEFAFFPTVRDGVNPSQLMWYYSSQDLEAVSVPGGAGTPEAQRLGGNFFMIEKPAGFDWGYVRISALTGSGTPAVDLTVWRDAPSA